MSPGPCMCVQLSWEHKEQAPRGHAGSWGEGKEKGLSMGFVLSYFGGGGGASPFPQPLFSLSVCPWGCWVEGSASSGAPTPSQGFLSPSLIYGVWLEPLRMKHSGAGGEQGGPLLFLLSFLHALLETSPRHQQEATGSALWLGCASKGPVTELEAEVGA